MSNVYFDKLNNAQNVEKIARIFGNDKPKYELRPNPILVLLVGSPGVGKTTGARKYFKEHFKLNYNDFYNISLDSIVERVKPYRLASKNLYNTLKKTKKPEEDLTNKNYDLLSQLYLPLIMSTDEKFKLNQAVVRIKNKIAGKENNESSNKSGKKPKSTLKNLNKMREEAFEYGVMNGYNILYDTTLYANSDKLTKNIMPILEKNKTVKYKIIVILVKAPKKEIKQRIQKRHYEMLKEKDPYIRAVSPLQIDKFITDNEEGFKLAKSMVKNKESEYFKKNPDTFYEPEDFKFKEIDNYTKSLSAYENSNFRYF